MTDREERILGSRYKLVRPVGFGGMAEVYLAHDMLLDREVAVKMLREQYLQDRDLLEQFRREARSAARLVHPYIINVFDVAAEGEEQYIVMEYVDGITLKEFMKTQQLSVEDVLEIGVRLADAMETAHEKHIIHCDIKPLNILIDKNMNPKIADFGIAKVVSSQTMVYTNSVMGSVHYISPEQANGGQITEASDVYSLGVVLFEMLTGQVPFNGPTPVAVAMMHAEKPVPKLSEYLEEVPEGLQEILEKAMAKKPRDRYRKAAQFRRDLMALKMKLFPFSSDDYSHQLSGERGVGRDKPVDGTDEAATVIMNHGGITDDSTMIMRPLQRHTQKLPKIPSQPEEEYKPVEPELEPARGRGEEGWWSRLKGLMFTSSAGSKVIPRGKGENRLNNEEENKPKTRKKLTPIGWMVTVTAVVAVISLLAGLFLNRDRDVEEIPNVTNMTVVEAQKLLKSKDFKVNLEEAFGDTSKYKPGTVMNQSPKAGEKRKQGSLITLTISKGSEIKGIPDIIGMPLAKAQNMLSEAGFELGEVKRTYVKDSRLGTVLEQSPKGTEKAPKGSKVDIVLNEGNIPVPNVIGKTQKEAEKMLLDAKLTVGEVRVISDASVPKGKVMSCSPSYGTNAGEGDKINLTISDGGQSKSAYVEFDVPGNKQTNVKITVTDGEGTKVLMQGSKKGGVRIRQKVEYGTKVKVQFYCDGQLVSEKVCE